VYTVAPDGTEPSATAAPGQPARASIDAARASVQRTATHRARPSRSFMWTPTKTVRNDRTALHVTAADAASGCQLPVAHSRDSSERVAAITTSRS